MSGINPTDPIGQATPSIEELEAENEFQIGQNYRLTNRCKILSKANCELEAENQRLKEELNMLKGLLDELIDDIDSSDIGQAKKTLRRYGHG